MVCESNVPLDDHPRHLQYTLVHFLLVGALLLFFLGLQPPLHPQKWQKVKPNLDVKIRHHFFNIFPSRKLPKDVYVLSLISIHFPALYKKNLYKFQSSFAFPLRINDPV